jgi:hypothetical protein
MITNAHALVCAAAIDLCAALNILTVEEASRTNVPSGRWAKVRDIALTDEPRMPSLRPRRQLSGRFLGSSAMAVRMRAMRAGNVGSLDRALKQSIQMHGALP